MSDAFARDSHLARRGARARQCAARCLVHHSLDLHVSGLDNVPKNGPAILVARHFHHLYDAAAILATVQREVHIVIALDWLPNHWGLALMRWLAAAARWPAVWRPGSEWRLNRAGYVASLELLRQGRLLLVFPEGYPTIDPLGPTRSHVDAFLPFDPGFLVLTERCDVPLIPVGLSYARARGDRWKVWLRFGHPLMHARKDRAHRQAVLMRLECAVRQLSAPPN